ncbi:uncharacterized protein [Amphiura filiformis]|uniref:uncharacterized protein n=1 Tax=Amphiura filiformis TaxID=82378 RepID=UPI003B21B068
MGVFNIALLSLVLALICEGQQQTVDCNAITNVPDDVRSYFSLDTFYTKYTAAYDIPILSSSEVSDNALQRACYVVQFMLADRKDVRKAFYDGKGRVAVFGVNQRPKDIPEHSFLSDEASDRGSGGYGGTLAIPVTTTSEKNLLCLQSDGYSSEDILVHEFAHAIHLIAMKEIDGEFQTSLQRAYANAKKTGLWEKTYAITNEEEYFAEGVQTFFNVNTHSEKANNINNNISSRDSLYRYDQELFQLVSGVFPCFNDVVNRCQGQEACVNENDHCDYWARVGECDKNPGYMHKYCQKSCGICNDYDTLSQSELIGMRNLRMDCRACVNDNDHCDYWAGIGECDKNPGYMHNNCQKSCGICNDYVIPRHCFDIQQAGIDTSGVYTIYPASQGPIEVYCDMVTDGGGWLVFQRRKDGSENFNRDWNSYKQGFGNKDLEFWLGNDNIFAITNQGTYELRVDMEDNSGNSAYAHLTNAHYTHFRIGDADAKYKLTVNGYNGTAGDSLGIHDQRLFTTKDQDNDPYSANCAVESTGAWWYNSCHESNLNGVYGDTTYGKGINWYAWKGNIESLKSTEMKIRPVTTA